MQTTRVMPTTYLLVSIVAMIALHFLLPAARILAPPWNLLGSIPLVLGVMLNVAADAAIHRAKTTVKPFEESSALITRGAFRVSRNPMYLGFVLILVGLGMLLRSVSPFLVIVAFAVVLNRAYVRVEERMLAEKFGAQWESYSHQIRRWL